MPNGCPRCLGAEVADGLQQVLGEATAMLADVQLIKSESARAILILQVRARPGFRIPPHERLYQIVTKLGQS